jgi:hypothetical protein
MPGKEVLRRRADLCHLLFRARRLDEARGCARLVLEFNTFDDTMRYILRVGPAAAEAPVEIPNARAPAA